MTGIGTLPIDDNFKPIQYNGVRIYNSKNLIGSGTTTDVPIFTVTGTVLVTGLWAVVTTALGNCTAAYFRSNDGSNTSSITLSTGTTLTNAVVGSTLVKKALAATAVAFLNAATEVVSEPSTLETVYFSPFTIVANTAATTNIEFVYTTSDTPTTGTIQFFASYVPVAAGGSLTTL